MMKVCFLQLQTFCVALAAGIMTNADFTMAHLGSITTVNKSTNYTESKRSALENAAIIVGFVCFCAVTIIGNLLIIIVIAVDKSLKTSTNMLYTSLATADMLVGLLVLPFFAVNVYKGYWSLGYVLCDLWLSADYLCCITSFFTLTTISYERYRAVSSPLKQRIRSRRPRIRCIIAILWTAAFLAWVPAILIIRNFTNVQFYGDCSFFGDKIYVIVACVVLYHIPIALTITFTTLVAILIRRSIRQQSHHVAYTGGTTSNDLYIIDGTRLPHTDSESPASTAAEQVSSQNTQSRNTRTNQARSVRMLALVVIAFLVSWVPWVTVWPLESFCPGTIPKWLYQCSYMGAYLNSSMNPFIYVFSNNKFRVAIKSLFCRHHK